MVRTKRFRLFCILLCLLLLSGCGVVTPEPTQINGTTEDKGTVTTAPTQETTAAPTTVPPTTVETTSAPLLVKYYSYHGRYTYWVPFEPADPSNEKPSPDDLPVDAAFEDQVIFYYDLLRSWYSCMRSFYYTDPKEINVDSLLRINISGKAGLPSEFSEKTWLLEQGFSERYSVLCLPAEETRAVLRDYFGLTLDGTGVLENYKYYSETDSYYTSTGYAECGQLLGICGIETLENRDVLIRFCEESDSQRIVELTLRPVGDHYQAVSNLIIAEGA